MDPLKMLDMEQRTGISQQEVDNFASRMDLISKAMEDIKNGTFDPLKCDIPGYKTPEQEEKERQERLTREDERRKREQERRRKEKQEEKEHWWHRAELRYSLRDAEEDEQETLMSKSERWANRILAAYKERDANDYSMWNQWVPEDPVSLQEKVDREAELEKLRNREFETNNPDFCNQFKKDMEERQRSQEEKERSAERLKQRGNRSYKKKQYADAIKWYMEALTFSPFKVAVLANIAQCYLRLDELDDCIEFCSRTLYIDADYVKALSRRATAYHRQKNLKEAADDMKRAFALEGDNPDIVEQHSIIVGDYEDSVINSELEAALHTKKKNAKAKDINSPVVEELRFSLELLEKIEEQQPAQEQAEGGFLQDSWIIYDLLSPFMERNEHVRAKFRTSGELNKLCDRFSKVLEAMGLLRSTPMIDPKHRQNDNAIVSAMINCAAAAVADTPRNQIVMFRHADFPSRILGALRSSAIGGLSWIVQASLFRFVEQVMDSKSWRNAVLSSQETMTSLFAALCYPIDEQNVSGDERVSKNAIVLAASSICFTLSSEAAGIQACRTCGITCLDAVAHSLTKQCCANSAASLHYLLGFLTNLSTDGTIRKTLEGNNCEDIRRKIVAVLLQIAQQASCENHDYLCSERALGALLNLSFADNSQVRTHDLVELSAVETVERIFSCVNLSTFSDAVLVLSRSASLLCRFHTVCQHGNNEATQRHLSSQGLLSKLYSMCEYANTSFGGSTTVIPDELWQLCAQVWCHFGWCSHLQPVRAFLREKQAVPLLVQVVALANDQNAYSRLSNQTTACERLVGNIVKVLIGLQSDHNPADSQTFRKERTINVLMKSLQTLPDGLARKNIAILLAKLCQGDSQVKEQVRELRGIEMMLSISQSLKQRPI